MKEMTFNWRACKLYEVVRGHSRKTDAQQDLSLVTLGSFRGYGGCDAATVIDLDNQGRRKVKRVPAHKVLFLTILVAVCFELVQLACIFLTVSKVGIISEYYLALAKIAQWFSVFVMVLLVLAVCVTKEVLYHIALAPGFITTLLLMEASEMVDEVWLFDGMRIFEDETRQAVYCVLCNIIPGRLVKALIIIGTAAVVLSAIVAWKVGCCCGYTRRS